MLLYFLSMSLFASAQIQSNETPMADSLRNSGKIYVVVCVVSIILVVVLITLFRIESRLRRLEKDHYKN